MEIIKTCRDKKIAVNTRMILVTADATLEVIESAKLICDEVITKPTTAHRLRRLLGEGDNGIENINSKSLLDPGPLTLLRRSGAQNEDLAVICQMFYKSVHATLEQIKCLPPMSAPTALPTVSMNDVVHRIRGSCLTVGADGLSGEFKHLAACTDAHAAATQFARTKAVFDSTQRLVEVLLLELEE